MKKRVKQMNRMFATMAMAVLFLFAFAVQAHAYTITATVNPSDGGFILGAGNFEAGQTCTLTFQVDAAHYAFLNWTENGEVVSISNQYSFTVEGDRNLVVNVVEKHFDNTSHQYPDVMTALSVVFIDGVEQTSPLLELGAFCGDVSRGSELPLYMNFLDRWMYFLTINGEDGQDIVFRLYDHATQQELDLECVTPFVFDEMAGYEHGLSNPYEIYFVSSVEVTQTTSLAQGWNWYSTYIEQEGVNGLEMMESGLGSNGLRIQGKNGSVDYFEYHGTGQWYGTLVAVTNEQMYKVRTGVACELETVGEMAQMENHPVTISNGWNWIGYPTDQSQSFDVALSGFTPEANDVIKGRNASSTYFTYGETGQWYGGLNTLEPGQGYMYKSNSSESKTLVFQAGRGDEELKPNVTPESNTYVPAGENYADNMLITAVVEVDGEELRSEDYELAAFVGDECRGSVKLMYVEPIDRYVAFLLAFGDKSEDLHFVLTDGTELSLSDENIRYENDGTVGTLTEPVTLSFGTLGVKEDQMPSVNIYPNPSKGVFNVEGIGIKMVEVMDAFGQVILSETVGNDNQQIDLNDRAAGAYLLRIVTDRGVATKKMVLVR